MNYKKSFFATQLPPGLNRFPAAESKRLHASCTINESYPSLQKTEINKTVSQKNSLRV